MAVTGALVKTVHVILDLDDQPLTGMVAPTDISFTLLRDTGAGFTSAPETVSMVEIAGQAGHYQITFTPLDSGIFTLLGNELNVNTAQRRPRWDFQVYSAGAFFVPAFANAFCSLSDVERWSQLAYAAASTPSDVEVAAFAESRAALLSGELAKVGVTLLPAGVVNGSIEQDLLREANAVGAAVDAVAAQFLGVNPSVATEKIELLDKLWRMKRDDVVQYGRDVLASRHVSHVSEGLVILPSEPATIDVGPDRVSMDEVF